MTITTWWLLNEVGGDMQLAYLIRCVLEALNWTED